MSGHVSWQMTEGRNPGKDKVITAFHCHRLALLVSTCILFQLGSLHWRKMSCTNCCLLLSPCDLWISSNFRAFFPYMLISRCLDDLRKLYTRSLACMYPLSLRWAIDFPVCFIKEHLANLFAMQHHKLWGTGDRIVMEILIFVVNQCIYWSQVGMSIPTTQLEHICVLQCLILPQYKSLNFQKLREESCFVTLRKEILWQ